MRQTSSMRMDSMGRAARVLTLLAVLAGGSGPALGKVEILTANFTPRAGPNAYSVLFPPELGGLEIVMPITGGQFRMAVDEEAETAQLLTWRQEIEPILINGMSTGEIVVTLDASKPSQGTYSSYSRYFEVTATFILEFDDSQLRQLGFTSPFALTATEQGSIYGVGRIGRISMSLGGTGQFGLGQFSYTCHTSAEFLYDLPAHLGQPGDVTHDHIFDVSDAVQGLSIMFLGSEEGCPGAIEVNGDASRDISDVVYFLDFLFQGGPTPPAEPVECQ